MVGPGSTELTVTAVPLVNCASLRISLMVSGDFTRW
jgi:hypothetical protein